MLVWRSVDCDCLCQGMELSGQVDCNSHTCAMTAAVSAVEYSILYDARRELTTRDSEGSDAIYLDI